MTASICLFCAVLLNQKKLERLFFLCSGAFIWILLLDDLFQVHEAMAWWYLKIPETVFYGLYAILTLSFAFYFRRYLMKTPYKILLTAMIFFSLSVLGDLTLPQEGHYYLLEDLFKIFGISTFSLYFLVTCYLSIKKQLAKSQYRPIFSPSGRYKGRGAGEIPV